MIKIKRKILPVLLNISFFLGVFIALYYLVSPAKIKYPQIATGEIRRFAFAGGAGAGENAELFFIVNKMSYRAFMSANSGLIVGDKYQVVYDSLNPERNYVNETIPIFLSNEKVNSAIGTVKKMNFSFGNVVKYEYKVDNSTYVRFQMFDKILFYPKEGDKYIVTYWNENPQRSIISLINPIKK